MPTIYLPKKQKDNITSSSLFVIQKSEIKFQRKGYEFSWETEAKYYAS